MDTSKLTELCSPKKPPVVVDVFCPRCRRKWQREYLAGMRRHVGNVFLAWCPSCIAIDVQLRRRHGKDIAGQLFLPLRLAEDPIPTPTVGRTPDQGIDEHGSGEAPGPMT